MHDVSYAFGQVEPFYCPPLPECWIRAERVLCSNESPVHGKNFFYWKSFVHWRHEYAFPVGEKHWWTILRLLEYYRLLCHIATTRSGQNSYLVAPEVTRCFCIHRPQFNCVGESVFHLIKPCFHGLEYLSSIFSSPQKHLALWWEKKLS